MKTLDFRPLTGFSLRELKFILFLRLERDFKEGEALKRFIRERTDRFVRSEEETPFGVKLRQRSNEGRAHIMAERLLAKNVEMPLLSLRDNLRIKKEVLPGCLMELLPSKAKVEVALNMDSALAKFIQERNERVTGQMIVNQYKIILDWLVIVNKIAQREDIDSGAVLAAGIYWEEIARMLWDRDTASRIMRSRFVRLQTEDFWRSSQFLAWSIENVLRMRSRVPCPHLFSEREHGAVLKMTGDTEKERARFWADSDCLVEEFIEQWISTVYGEMK